MKAGISKKEDQLKEFEKQYAELDGKKALHEKETDAGHKKLREEFDAKYQPLKKELDELNSEQNLKDDQAYETLVNELNVYKMTPEEYVKYTSRFTLTTEQKRIADIKAMEDKELANLTQKRKDAEETLTAYKNQLKIKDITPEMKADINQYITEQQKVVNDLTKEEKELKTSHNKAQNQRQKDYDALAKTKNNMLKNIPAAELENARTTCEKNYKRVKDRIDAIEGRSARREELANILHEMNDKFIDDQIAYTQQRDTHWTKVVLPEIEDDRGHIDIARDNVLEDLNTTRSSLTKALDSKDELIKNLDKSKSNLDLAKTAVSQKQEAVNQINSKLAQLQPKEMQKGGPSTSKT